MKISGVITGYIQGMTNKGKQWRMLTIEGLAAFVPGALEVPTEVGTHVVAEVSNTGFRRVEQANSDRYVSVPQFQVLSVVPVVQAEPAL